MWEYLDIGQSASDLIRDEVVISAFKKNFPSDAEQRLQRISEGHPLDDDESDLLADVLLNESRLYLEFRGPVGDEFPIEVRGLGGVYYAWAPDIDEVGLFDSLTAAEAGVERKFYGMDLWFHKKCLDEFYPPAKPRARATISHVVKNATTDSGASVPQ